MTSLSFGQNKKLEVSYVSTDTPGYKCVNSRCPVYDLATKVEIGISLEEEDTYFDANGKAILAEHCYHISFYPNTNIKGVVSYAFSYDSEQLLPDGEHRDGTFVGNVDTACSSGDFLGWEGFASEVHTGDIRVFTLDFVSNVANH